MPPPCVCRPTPAGLRRAAFVAALVALAPPSLSSAAEAGGPRSFGPRRPAVENTRGLSRIYFPPTPPRLRAPLSLMESFELGLGRPAPGGLAEHVNEPFYAPLSTRLDEKDLRPEEAQRLQAYRSAKLSLQIELRRKIEQWAGADADTREQALAAFAREQAPRVDALEAEAESIRDELVRYTDNWNTYRRWHLGSTPFPADGTAMRAQQQVMRAAAYYQKGLSPAQRRLLREIAMELDNYSLLPVSTTELSPDSNPLLYFSPETARVRLPSVPTAELATLISAYEQKKSVLKKALRDTVYEEDTAPFSILRQRKLEELAKAQESGFAELEHLAEQIRRAYARSGAAPRPPSLPALPPDLTARFENYLESRERLERAVVQVLQDIQANVAIEQVGTRRNEAGRFELFIVLEPGPQMEAERIKVDAILGEFNARHLARIERLAGEQDAIRRAIGWIGGLPANDPNAVDRRMREFAEAFAQRQLWEHYRDYQHAVLEPGLSPGQRRILYDAALESLELPLPGGRFQPRG